MIFGMALDFSEAAGYYGMFTFLPVLVLTRGVVDVSADWQHRSIGSAGIHRCSLVGGL